MTEQLEKLQAMFSRYTTSEEKFNIITHGLGIVLSIVGIFYLLFHLDTLGSLGIVAVVLFGLSLLNMYCASTIYHLACLKEKPSSLNWRVFDHVSIFFLIAGTYTPFTLIGLKDGNGILICAIIWLLAIVGSIFKLFFTGKYKIATVIVYIAMGCLALFDITGMIEYLPQMSLWLLICGGLFYIGGTVFYLAKRMKYNHGIWHLFVLSGSACHFFGVTTMI